MNISDMFNEIVKKIGKDNTDTLFLIIIIVYFFYLFILYFRDILYFLLSRYNIVSEEIPTKTPYNDVLYMRYCNLSEYEGKIIDTKILEWFISYFILFILFWTNTILNKLSIDSMSNEIKILGYSKYYNSDVTNDFDYNFLNYLSYYIILMLFLIGYMFTYNFMYENDNIDKEVYRSMYNFSNEIKNNIVIDSNNDDPKLKYKYLELLQDNSIEESIENFVKGSVDGSVDGSRNRYNLLFGDTSKSREELIDMRLKLLVTYLIAKDNIFTHLKYKVKQGSLYSLENIFNRNCIYAYLGNPVKNVIFPNYEDIPYRLLYTKPVQFDQFKSVDLTAIQWDMTDSGLAIEDEELKDRYNEFKGRIEEYSRDVNKHHQDQLVKYKLWLIFFAMSGLIVTVFTIIFFLLEINLIKSLWGYINFKDFIMSNLFIIIMILTIFILIVGAIIINL